MQRYLNVNKAYVNTLENDELSIKRLKHIKNIHNNYGLPSLHINKALHYDNDKEYIKNKYPTIKRSKFNDRPGAYGLNASFMQFLENNKNTTDNFIIWYEDDAIPAENEDLFDSQLDIAMQLILNDNNVTNNVYYLAYTNYCKKKCENVNKWIKKTYNTKNGSHCIIFTKSSINSILNYMEKNTIKLPIDNLLYFLHGKGIINAYDWGNNILDEKGMFCGLFTQLNTYCDKRVSVINNIT